MFSGKTSKLLAEMSVHEGLGHSILIVNHVHDDRAASGQAQSSGILTCHQLTPTRLDNVKEVSVDKISKVPYDLIEKADVIGVDESQFFDDIELILNWVRKDKKLVYCAGLMTTSEGTLFGNFYKLLPFAIIKQRFAVCTICMRKMEEVGIYGRPLAAHTTCLGSKNSDILVGSDKYIATCFNHWNEAQVIGSEKFCEKYGKYLSDGAVSN